MKSLKNFSSSERYSIDPNMTNKETYQITKSKFFANDTNIDLNQGAFVSREEFTRKKNCLTESFPREVILKVIKNIMKK